MDKNQILLFLVLFPMIGGIVGYCFGHIKSSLRDIIVIAVSFIELFVLLVLLQGVLSGGELDLELHSFSVAGLHLKLDGFRLIYTIITALMWVMTALFSKEYFQEHHNKNRYYFFYLVTFSATIGVFLSADFMTTFLFFEMLSFTSYVFVVQEESIEAIKASKIYLAVSVIGGMVLLMGLFLLQSATGTLEFEQLSNVLSMSVNPMILYAAGGCMLFGFGAKAGMFPLHIWLPKAHPVAPAPASALLSGILTKTGVFGILVICRGFLRNDAGFSFLVLCLGTATMVVGAVLALVSIDLKRTLACSSVSQIGFVLIGIGMQGLLAEHNALAVRGTMLHMVNHSLFKLLLFLVAGVVYMNLHQLNLNEIRGFGRNKPALLISFGIGALGISGVPFFSGYISKTLLHESIVEGNELLTIAGSPHFFTAIEWIFILSGAFTFAYMLKLFVALFVEKNTRKDQENRKKEYMNWTSRIAVCGSAVLVLLLGLFPEKIMNQIADVSSGFFYGADVTHEIHYFSLNNQKGAGISIVIGLLLYFLLVRICLMKKENGEKIYIDVWPKWLDLIKYFYQPVFFVFLPFFLSFIFRILDRMTDSLVHLMQVTVLRTQRPKRPPVAGTKMTYYLGTACDDIVLLLNKTILRKHPWNRSFVKLFALGHTEVYRTSRLIIKSVSFALFLFCIGLMITLSYLLYVVLV